MKFRFTARARLEIERNDKWWREHRSAAATLFLEELVQAVERVLQHPGLGKTYPHSKHPGVLYVILPRTRRNLYYVVIEGEVVFVAVWGGQRRRGPKV